MGKTLHDTYVAGLQRMGYSKVPDGTSRGTLLHKEGSSAAYVWVGRAGSVRINGVKRFDGSRALGPKSKAKIAARAAEPVAVHVPGVPNQFKVVVPE